MAAWTLFDLTYRVAREIASMREGLATGGSTTTVIDTARLQNQYADDWFNLGTVWILRDSAGAGAAPEKEYARISDFVSSTGTITMEAVSSAVAAGDRYAAASGRYSLDAIIAAINAILATILIPTEDTTTLDTASAQLEYDLPAAVLDENIEVFIQGYTGDADSNRWTKLHGWYIAETGTGTQKKLIFYSQPISGRDLKIRYYLPHTPLYSVTDDLREGIHINRVVYGAAYWLLGNEMNNMSLADKALLARLQRYEEMYKLSTPGSSRQTHKLATFGQAYMGTGEDD